jgi:hypothetical protein
VASGPQTSTPTDSASVGWRSIDTIQFLNATTMVGIAEIGCGVGEVEFGAEGLPQFDGHVAKPCIRPEKGRRFNGRPRVSVEER